MIIWGQIKIEQPKPLVGGRQESLEGGGNSHGNTIFYLGGSGLDTFDTVDRRRIWR